MKHIYSRLLFTLLGMVALISKGATVRSCDVASDNRVTPLTVLTYNIQACASTNIDTLAAFINQCEPDFVALQEVDVNTSRRSAPHINGHNIIAELAGKTGMFDLYGRTIDFAGGYYGIAILSKYPLVSSVSIPLPNPGDVEPRILLIGRYFLPSGDNIAFACTHLDYLDLDTRRAQVDSVVSAIRALDCPVILAGDFNATPDEELIHTLTSHFSLLSGLAPTWSTEQPTDRLDYIFAYPVSHFTLISTTEPIVTLSDHLPVVSKILFNPRRDLQRI